MIEQFTFRLYNRGFSSLEGCENGVNVLYKIDNGVPRVLLLIDCDMFFRFNNDMLHDIEHRIEEAFLGSGFSFIYRHTVFFVKDLKAARKYEPLTGSEWFVYKPKRDLVVYENQPEDFAQIRSELEMVLYGHTVDKSFTMRQKNIFSITNILILINSLVYFIMAFNGDVYDLEYLVKCGAAYTKFIYERGEIYRLFTAMFIHIGFGHLFGNMLVFYFFGNSLERCIGKIKFSILYFVGGMISSAGSFFYYLICDNYVVAAGASGAISAVIAGLLAISLFDKTKRYILKPKQIAFYIGYMIYSGLNSDGVDNVAHIVGLIAGFIIGAIIVRDAIAKGKM